MESEGSKKAVKQPMEAEAGDPEDPHDLVSSDEEIDYSVEPEFYDPAIDDVDERWAHKQRKGRTSDAVLSCPACFTTLCLDSQRHEKYVNQYRAMFVSNCKVKTDQILREGKGKRKNRKVTAVDSTTPEVENKGPVFHPVCCEVCSTEVGVAALGLGISFTSMWFLRQTSATTYSLVGSLNKIPLSVAGIILFKVRTSMQNSISILFGLLAGVFFARAKLRGNSQS